MGVPTVNLAPMTVEEFLSFTDTRPDEENWELVDGEPVLNAAPSYVHQRIVGNLLFSLTALQRQAHASWTAIPGIGVRVSAHDLPQPDVLIRPAQAPYGDPRRRECDDMIVAFETLSPSTADRDMRWKRRAYSRIPSLSHDVVIAQDEVDVAVFSRSGGFAEARLSSKEDALRIPELGISLPLAEIYRDTGLV